MLQNYGKFDEIPFSPIFTTKEAIDKAMSEAIQTEKPIAKYEPGEYNPDILI